MTETNAQAIKWVFSFKNGDGKNKKLLGGKGANLCEMTRIGLNVPPGFVITTDACLKYLEDTQQGLPAGVMDQVQLHLREMEQATSRRFGDENNPLLVSVRSGAAMSMPGMMDTILNLGLNNNTLNGLIAQTGNRRFGYDAYRRFIQLFGQVALGINSKFFDNVLENVKAGAGVAHDVGLSAQHLSRVTEQFLEVVRQKTGKPFPEDPMEQLQIAIRAVFNSWTGKRAVDYRRQFNITPDKANGTAVSVVAMVFGNLGDDSATGVAFTRYPDTGENRMYGEYLTNAQGEDVVAGIRTPKPIDAMRDEMPAIYQELLSLRNRLESHYREVQDFEFTIEKGRLYCLQTRNGKMNAAALVHTSVAMVKEGIISREQSLLRIQPELLEQLLFPHLDPAARRTPLARGLAASPGAAVGKAVFDADRAEKLGSQGQNVILVREETKPEDIHGFFKSQGILTSRGGKTSHAAVVARGMGKPCVAGAEGITVDVSQRKAFVGNTAIAEGDLITLDGTTGDVYLGAVPLKEASFPAELATLLSWADDVAKLKVRANADTPGDAKRAVEFGAQGIGLCRTERMFNASDRLPIVVEMILAEDAATRQAAIDQLLPFQRDDFRGIFGAMAGRPVTIRLLDPPIHEFLPSRQQLEEELAELQHLRIAVRGANILSDAVAILYRSAESHPAVERVTDPRLIDEVIERKTQMLKKVNALQEVNPMLGHRGVRLGITFPEIYSMQIRAVLEAAAQCIKAKVPVQPEIMVPQVCTKQELLRVKAIVDAVRLAVEANYGVQIPLKFGSMLEVVRACIRAGSLAETSEFFSFGTNDLTQATFSFSREDAENKFLPMYHTNNILHDNPFEVLDISGVGKIMELAVGWAKDSRPDIKVGICGEHGGHPASINFCHQIGLDYVSCSGPRVPIARLAAAHAALLHKGSSHSTDV
ncbi:pyruvate phosphate dikinase [Achromatium sp. WMS2]|nr:pyruvate phosphate dikinase [Achromatium sp. WMS2]